jgi:hypothetical protein
VAGVAEDECVRAAPADGCRCPVTHPLQALDSFVECVDRLSEMPARAARVSSFARPPSYAMDGDGDTYWRSPAGLDQVNLTVDVQGRHQLFSVHIDFASALPHSFVMERSMDGGSTFTPWRFYSEDCAAIFGMESSMEADVTDENLVICTTPPSGGATRSITFTLFSEDSLPEELIGVQQEIYTQFSLFTHLRLRFEQLKSALPPRLNV